MKGESMDFTKANFLIELGITGHEDLGSKDGFYRDLISLGPFSRIVSTEKEYADKADNPAETRFSNTKAAIVDFLDAITEIREQYIVDNNI